MHINIGYFQINSNHTSREVYDDNKSTKVCFNGLYFRVLTTIVNSNKHYEYLY